jgi:CRP-like cAMP-binding protein
VDPGVCSLDYRLKIIGRLPFFRHLPSEAIIEINRLFEDRDVAAEQAIYFEGDPGENLYLVASGKVKLMRLALSGREVLLDILQGSEYFGHLAIISQQGYAETAIAQTDCCILQITSQDFEQILNRYPEVTMKVLKAVGQRLEESQEIIKQLSVYTIEQRIAATLIRVAKKLGEQKQTGMLIQIPFSRQDLAAMTGTTVETVSRVMSRFAAVGLISTGRKWVVLNDLQHLEQIAKEGAAT